MEDQNLPSRRRVNNNTWTGLLLLAVGVVLLLKQTGYPFPEWLFSWEMLVIVLGLFIGVRNRFRDFAWLIMVVSGLVFISDDIFPEIRLRQYVIPIVIIAVGLLFILAPRRVCRGKGRTGPNALHVPPVLPMESALPAHADTHTDTVLDIVSIFAGVKKNVISKQFRGGEVVCVFGGAEINLTNADFTSPIIIDVVNVFGGTKLIVPSNWEVRSEVTAIFGGIDDKRAQGPNLLPEKVIILKGTIMFGGIEVNSF